MRLSDGLIANERYRGEPTTDEEGRTQWPVCVIWDDDLQGFGIRIFPPVRGKPSRKDFIVSWKLGLKSRTMAIGTYGVDCTLRQARRTAREALDLARRGQDPIEARQRALGIGTTEDLASRFLFEHTAAKKKPAAPATPDAGAEATAGGSPEAEAALAAEGPAEAPGEGAVPSTAAAPQAAQEVVPAADAATSSLPPPIAIEPVAARATPGAETADAEPAPEPEQEPEPEAEIASDEAGAAPSQAPSPTAERAAAPSANVPPAGGAPKIDDARRWAMPPPPVPSTPKRGPTKVRLLPVPDSLYRTIEHGARESGMTVAAYLGALVEIARAAVGEDAGEHQTTDASGTTSAENGPSIRELFARVQEAQAVEVGKSSAAGGGSELDESSD